jgi:hypothetical protein
MNRAVRLIMLMAAVGQIIVAIGFFAQMSWTSVFWPFDYTENLSFIFMASIAGAAAASTLWCLYTREDAGFAGIGLDYIAIFGPLAVLSIQKYSRIPDKDLILLIVAGFAGVGFGLVLFFWSRRIPFHQTQPTPRPVRIAFGIFIVALLLVGTALALKTDNIMPWRLGDEASILYGWFFLGAALYFVYGLIYPVWGNAGGQLAGFLVYDLVLIIPFLLHFQTVRPELTINLVIYIIVLISSGLVAAYYLFINPATRLARGSVVQQIRGEPAL